ncbi:MAG: hypothetical protein LJE59_04020 [Chromatiaceae bacterium]|nr:hypothetical protein [Chromatiaceae bacterium]
MKPVVAALFRQQRRHHARDTVLLTKRMERRAYPPLQIDYERFGVYQIGEV